MSSIYFHTTTGNIITPFDKTSFRFKKNTFLTYIVTTNGYVFSTAYYDHKKVSCKDRVKNYLPWIFNMYARSPEIAHIKIPQTTLDLFSLLVFD